MKDTGSYTTTMLYSMNITQYNKTIKYTVNDETTAASHTHK